MTEPVWVVKSVATEDNHTLRLTFADGKKGVFDMRPLLSKPIFKPLNNLSFFKTAKVECGTVVWNDEIDIAPEYLYEMSQSA